MAKVAYVITLWLAAIALSLTLYAYGQVEYYWYANDKAQGYELRTWKGNSLDDEPGYAKGYTYRHSISRFEKNAEARTISIILILSGAAALSVRLLKRRPKT